MKSTHLNGRRSSIIEICDNAAYLSFSFEASCPKKCDFRRKNRKPKYLDPATGLYPFVHLIEASGKIYPEAERFLVQLKKDLERKQREKESLSRRFVQSIPARPFGSKDINAFRSDPRYGGDGTRIDLAYAIYALAHGSAVSDVQATIRSRDLSHKGSERRQNEYVERTIKKALGTLERGR